MNAPARLGLWLVPLLAALAMAFTSSVHAQDAARVEAGMELWKKAGCPLCHGPFADGSKEQEEMPTGANIRRTRLDRAALAETIACGRAQMPYFDADAFTKRSCYGVVGVDAPGKKGNVAYSKDEIEILVDYLGARVVGKGNITRAECDAYYKADASLYCTRYR